MHTFKAATFLASISLISCNNIEYQKAGTLQVTELSNDEKETAKREITARIDEIIKGANSLDVEAAIKPYLNDHDFKIVNPDASVTDFQIMKKHWLKFSRQWHL